MGEIGFLRIGVDPDRGVDDAEHRRAGHHEAAELDLLDLRRDAGHRRAHHVWSRLRWAWSSAALAWA